ncbi:hypothetical protein ABH935_009942 [Catenulispora sp. GAS73]|uniref:hypothetical protein n=1 Tax=Catenulispora sp. GAS73 TaxID=3156269 RepID=UPI003512EDD5
MSDGTLSHVYDRLHTFGPEWGADRLTNHGPMAAEVLVRHGRAEAAEAWTEAYVRRLIELPSATWPITEENGCETLGEGNRYADWTRYFEQRLTEATWQEELALWRRLLPGIVAGATHGVIRTGHVVRALLAGADHEASRTELAHALALWAARFTPVPGALPPSGELDAGPALDGLDREPGRSGTVAERLGRLATTPAWPRATAALRPAADPQDVPNRLADLVAAATERYLRFGHGSPVLLVHTATAPNAVLHTLPALPETLWEPSLAAVWSASAAIYSAYGAETAAPDKASPTVPESDDPVARAVDAAVAHGDEHVIKFTDTAAEVYTRSGSSAALAAVERIRALIPATRV